MKSSSENQGRKLESLQAEAGSGSVEISLAGPLHSKGLLCSSENRDSRSTGSQLSLSGCPPCLEWGRVHTLDPWVHWQVWALALFHLQKLFLASNSSDAGVMRRCSVVAKVNSPLLTFFLIVQPGGMCPFWTQEKRSLKLYSLASEL